MVILTEKENIILVAISNFIEEKGFSPTVREIGDLTGFKSSSSVHKYLLRLRDKGKIEWNPTRNRTIIIK